MDAFATTAQLAAYLGVDVDELPAKSAQMLDRASELLDSVSMGRYHPATADPEVVDRMVKATCAQVEMWIASGDGEGADIGGGYQSYSTGTVSVQRGRGAVGTGSSDASRLAPRARTNLFRAGMLYAGVRVRATPGLTEIDDED